MDNDIFDDKNFGTDTEMSSLTVDWGVPGDFIQGTFVRARHGVETQFGPNSIYEILAEKGQFHKLTKKKPADKPTLINKGEVWGIWGRNDLFNGQMNTLKPGQVVKLGFTDEVEGKMGPAKIIKIYAPKDNEGKPLMNKEWLDGQSAAAGEIY